MAGPDRPLRLAAGLIGVGARDAPLAEWRRWTAAAAEARLDVVTLQDVRLDPAVLAAALAPEAGRSGLALAPGIATTDAPPEAVAARVATVERAAPGQAGWLARVPARADAVQAAEGHLAAVRRAWGAAAPPVLLPAGDPDLLELAVRWADVVLVPAWGAAAIAHALESVEVAQRDGGRTGERLVVLADLAVPDGVGVDALADELLAGHAAGLDGFRLIPPGGPGGLLGVLGPLVATLAARGVARSEGATLRERLDLPAAAGAMPDALRALDPIGEAAASAGSGTVDVTGALEPDAVRLVRRRATLEHLTGGRWS